MAAAREAAMWDEVDEVAIRRAWDERHWTREQAQVLVPSSVFYRDPRLDGEQIVYVAGHEVDGRNRGHPRAESQTPRL